MGIQNQASTNRTSGLAVLSPKLASKSASEVLLLQWFVKFSTLKQEEFHKPFIDLWVEALSDLDPEWIEFGCRIYFRSMKFFPKPGDIRELVDDEKRSREVLGCWASFAALGSHKEHMEEIEFAIRESRRLHIPADDILRERREARERTAAEGQR